MLSSMTGFANTIGSVSDFNWTFEVKSVNGRGLDLRLHLPNGCESLEIEIRSRFKDSFARGNMQAGLQIRDRSDGVSYRVDTRLLSSLARRARIQDRASSGMSLTRASDLMAIRGVMSGEKETVSIRPDSEVGAAILNSVDAAIKQLAASRKKEGDALTAVLERIVTDMVAEVERARETADAQPAQMKARLSERVSAVLENARLSEDRLEQEVAVLITKADVTEEIDRLKAHFEDAKRLLALNEPVGRKLDFLSQELLREANTMGSKAASLEMTRHSLALKSLIDQFKEQAANVE